MMEGEKKKKKLTAQKRSVRKKSILKVVTPAEAKVAPEPVEPKAQPAKTAATPKVKKIAAAAPIIEQPTPEQIRLRAYFICQHRHEFGIPGDEHGDWIQAEEELKNLPWPRR